jgi:hypothetical protein
MDLWPPFSGYLDHTYRHTVGLLWTSDELVSETSTYTGQHNIETQETNIHTFSGIRTRDPSNQAAAGLRLRSLGHWDRHKLDWYTTKNALRSCSNYLQQLTVIQCPES